MASGLGLGVAGRTEAEGAATWEALGPTGKAVDRLYTPARGALLARAGFVQDQRQLLRSDDGGLTWSTILGPADAGVITVSPTDHQLLFAAGTGGVYRSQDGGGTWERVSEQGDDWRRLELSPADPNVLYDGAATSPPAEFGTNNWRELRVGIDGRYLFAATDKGVHRIALPE